MGNKLYLCTEFKFGRTDYNGFTKGKRYDIIGVYEGGFYVLDDNGVERQMSYQMNEENYWKYYLKNES